MRKDMSKKLVDTRRLGNGRNSKNMRYRRERLILEEYEDEEGNIITDIADSVIHSHKTGIRDQSWSRKEFGENLNPLWRYLQSQLNNDWDEIYSDICEHMDRRSAVGGHIFEHLWGYVVPKNKVRIIDNIPYKLHAYKGLSPITYKSNIGQWECFYIDPRDNKLKHGVPPKESPWDKRARKRREDQEDRLRNIGRNVWMSRHPETNLWYRLIAVDQEYQYIEVEKRDIVWTDDRMSFKKDENGNFVYNVYTKIEERGVHESVATPQGLFLPKGKVVISCKSASKKDLKLLKPSSTLIND